MFKAHCKPKFNGRRLQNKQYDVVHALARALLAEWTDGRSLALTVQFSALRELKVRFKKDTENLYKRAAVEALAHSTTSSFQRSIETHFSSLVKDLARIAANVADEHYFDDMFESLLEDVVDKVRSIDSSRDALAALFDALLVDQCPRDKFAGKRSPEAWQHWKTFLRGMKASALVLYDRAPRQT